MLIGFVFLALLLLGPDSVAQWPLIVPAGIPAVWGTSVVLHELGHLFAAKAFKLRPGHIQIGEGPMILEWHSHGVRWALKGIPISGRVYVWPLGGRQFKWPMLAMVLAGPAVNGAIAGVAFYLMVNPVAALSSLQTASIGFPFLLPALVINALLFLGTLIPLPGLIDKRELPTDGLQIIQLLKGTHPTLTAASSGTTRTLTSCYK